MKQIVGGRVEEGVVQSGVKVVINRRREAIGAGTITQLRQEQNVVDEMAKGKECGMLIESPTTIEEGDVLEVFKEEVIKRTL